MLTHRPLSRRHLTERVAPNALRPVGEGVLAAQQQQQRTPLDTVSSDVLDALLNPRERAESAAVEAAEAGRSSNPRDLQALLADVLESSRVRVLVERKEQACRSLDSVLGFVLQSYEAGGSAAEPLAQRLRLLQPTAPYVTISEALKLIKHEEKRYASRSDFNEHVATKLSWLTQQLSAAHERAEIAEEKTARLCECVGALHRARLAVGRRLRSLQAAFTERVTEFRRQEINAEERAEAQASEVRRLREEAELGRRWQRQSRAAAHLGRTRGRQSVAALPGHSFGGFGDGGVLDVAAAAALAGSAADGAEAVGGGGGGGGGSGREAGLEEEVARLQGMLEEVRQAEEGRRRKEQIVDAYLSQQQRQIGGVDPAALDVVPAGGGVEGDEVATAAAAATDRALALCRQRAEEAAVLRAELEAAQRQAEAAAELHRAHAAEARALAEARELAQAEEASQLREQLAAATEAAEAATDARHATRQRLANLQRLLFNSPSTRDVLPLVGSPPAVAAGDGDGTAATPPAEMSVFLSELQQNLNEFLAGDAADASAGGAPLHPPSPPLTPTPPSPPPPLETAEQEAAEVPLPSPSPSPKNNTTRSSPSPVKAARGGGGGGGKQRSPSAAPDLGPRQRALRVTEAAGNAAVEAVAKAEAAEEQQQQAAEGCDGGGADARAVQARGTQTVPPAVSQAETGTTRTGAPSASVGVLTDKTAQTAMFDPRTDPWRPDESHANVLRAILATRDYELRTLQKKLIDRDTAATCAGAAPTEQEAGGGSEGDAGAKSTQGQATRKRLLGVVGALRPAAAGSGGGGGGGGKGFRFRDDAEVRRCGSNSFDLYLLKCDEVQQLTTILHDLLTEHDRLCKRAAAEAPDGSEERQRAADGGAERPPLPPPSTAAEATREAQLRAKDVIISAERAENRGLLRCLKRVAKQASGLLSGYLGCESAYACPHCLCPMREPVVLSPCGHAFCATCLGLPSDSITGGAVFPKRDEAAPACPECLEGASTAAAPVPLLESSMASYERHKAVLTEYCDGVRAVLVEAEGMRDVYKSQQQKQRGDSSAAAAQNL